MYKSVIKTKDMGLKQTKINKCLQKREEKMIGILLLNSPIVQHHLQLTSLEYWHAACFAGGGKVTCCHSHAAWERLNISKTVSAVIFIMACNPTECISYMYVYTLEYLQKY